MRTALRTSQNLRVLYPHRPFRHGASAKTSAKEVKKYRGTVLEPVVEEGDAVMPDMHSHGVPSS
ncbi:hypothetical protein DACRYDRAFT_105889 [Dacryopinax primogenitus]|uniref:Uncharacterized protein n=1 Tax=Dacryopinax primogenitus (strain DJM 731) TaxID=1858805 RepID=M5GC92_DACPD|nr:uncharacterized protein DACRYDRAFT_105889 [Dacryopinax primogenitus]EJU03732.1 hypothetical protein DACRYDRAFT_105889 [Dacryopinax primogenitus]